MKMAIFGAGKAGKALYRRIKDSDLNITVQGFIDNILQGTYETLKIFKPEEYFDLFHDTEAVIIAAGDQKTVKIMIDTSRKYNVNHIFLLQDIAGKCDLPVFDENGFIPLRLREIRFSDKKPTLPYFEIPITDRCNLNCKGCLFLCNAKGEGTDIILTQILSDLKRMSELFEDIPWIRILGGEPLLHPDIIRVLQSAREYFPDSEIDLCTNGLLLPGMDETFWTCMIQNRISIHISGYAPINKMMDRIAEVLAIHNLPYALLERNEFMKYYTINRVNDKEKSFLKCRASACREVYRGRLSTCSAAIAFEKLNKQYGTSYVVTKNVDWFDIHDRDIDIWKVCETIDKPTEICKYCSDCTTEYFPWDYAGDNPALTDYVIED